MTAAARTNKVAQGLGWLLLLLVCGLSGASILVALQDFARHARSNGGVEVDTYLFLYGSLTVGLLSVGYQASQRYRLRAAMTGLGLLPVLGLLLLIGPTLGWGPDHGYARPVQQVVHRDSTSVYTFVEQQPSLPTGSFAAISDTLSAHAQRQLTRAGQSATGTVQISWIVNRKGRPSHLQIEQGVSAAADSAVVAAVRELTLNPGKQNGQAVAVRLRAVARLSAAGAAGPAADRRGGSR